MSNETFIHKYFSTEPCKFNPFTCTSKLKSEQYRLEIKYINRVFHATYRKFLTAIDQIDYHPSQVQNTTRTKRSEEYGVYGYYHSYTRTLTPSEEIFLDKFLIALHKINPSLHWDLSRMKRFSILTWILGWGIFSNAQRITKIKGNFYTLQKQNQLQDKQIIHLAKHLNLTMHQVSQCEEMLYEMDTKMFIMNKAIPKVMMGIDFLWYESDLLAYFQARVLRLHSSLYALMGDVDSLYEYIRALATQELNPMIIPPDIPKKILNKIMEDIKSNTRLRLSEDPKPNIWAYYGNVKLTPIVLQDYLMLILTVPLIDQSLQMNLYKVYDLPMLHPTLNVHAQYEIEKDYLATLMEGMFISLPSTLDIKLFLVTNGHLCIFDQALYPVERINWCVYALFINDYDRIRRDCLLKTLARITNLAYSLDGYLWAISALAVEKLQIRYVMETHIIKIATPSQIVDVGNGCEASSANIYIPTKSELTATLQSITRSQFFLDFNLKYTNISNFLVWYNFNFAELTEAKVKKLKTKILQLPSMSMDMFENTIEYIDEDYPFSLSPKIILILLVVVCICIIALGIIFIWYKRKATLSSSTVGNLVKLVPSLDDNTPSLDSLLPIISELAPSRTESQATPTTSHQAAADKLTFLTPSTSITGLHTTPTSLSVSSTQPPTRLLEGPSNKTHKPKYTSVGDTTEPVSLEMFNKATTDLGAKGMINLRKYTNYLARKDSKPV